MAFDWLGYCNPCALPMDCHWKTVLLCIYIDNSLLVWYFGLNVTLIILRIEARGSKIENRNIGGNSMRERLDHPSLSPLNLSRTIPPPPPLYTLFLAHPIAGCT